MRTLRLARWSGSVPLSKARPSLAARVQTLHSACQRFQSTAAATQDTAGEDSPDQKVEITQSNYNNFYRSLSQLPSPPHSAALSSSKLAALHSRLQLSKRIPLQTLARCLVHPSADSDPSFNNRSLEILGADILGYYATEVLLCTYPRLPLDVAYNAVKAYVGPAACATIAKEWGVEVASEPGGEVDPGLLQFLRKTPGNADLDGDGSLFKDLEVKGKATWKNFQGFTPSTTAASIADTYFGPVDPTPLEIEERPELIEDLRRLEREKSRVTLMDASMSFVRALIGAIYLHAGRDAAKEFYNNHFRTRKLDVSKLFYFKQPTRDLSRLCAREGFESPVGRIISETGRATRHPVYVIGVFSGREKLGEGAGASLDEARIRAAISALKGWYLYSPLKITVPSDVEGKKDSSWEPVLIDGGEIIV